MNSRRSLLALFAAVALLPSALPSVARAQTASPQRYEEKKREANDIAVSIVVSGLSCTCARFAEDIRNVVNDLRPEGIRILPILGVGGLQNLNDVLFLKGVDMGVVDQDNLVLLKQRDPKLYANVEQRVQYITKLYNAEFHLIARNDIKSYSDLKNKKVSFNLKDSQTDVTAQRLFNMLNIPVERLNFDNDEAIKRLLSGEISAHVVVTGAPQAALAKLKAEDGVHFLPLDPENMPGYDLTPILADYLPAELTHQLYPNLIPEGSSVPTVANRAILAVYAWPEGSERYRKLVRFVNEFFGKINQFNDGARHPKWKEINLWAEIPGWTRFKPAADWLAAHENISANDDGSNLLRIIEKFRTNYQRTAGNRPITESDRELILKQVKQFLDAQNAKPVAR
jgi:uncharacterized protein